MGSGPWNLRLLDLIAFSKLEALPGWMSSVTSLDTLRIIEFPQLTERCKQTTGDDWHKIKSLLCQRYIYIDGLNTREN